MKKFINLLNFEMNRFLKFLVPTLLIAFIVQIFQTIGSAYMYNRMINVQFNTNPNNLDFSGDDLGDIGKFSMEDVTGTSLFTLSVLLIVLVFVFYSFFVWYRDWLGKNTFTYRLLMLPMNRTNIILAKSLIFIIGGLLAYALQFGMLYVNGLIAKLIVIPGSFLELSVPEMLSSYDFILHVLYPRTMIEFLSRYSFAFAALISLFTGIIIERSYGFKGAIGGIFYSAGYFILYFFIMGVDSLNFFPIILRPSQLYVALIVYQFITMGLGFLVSHFLLKNKIKI